MKTKTDQTVDSNIQRLSKSIMHYFNCSGCTECSPEVRNRHFLRGYKSEFGDDIKRFGEKLKEELKQSVENLREELETSIYLNQLSSQMDELIKKWVQELTQKIMSKSLTEKNVRRSFDRFWTNVVDAVLKKTNPKEKIVYIKASVERVIANLLAANVHKYNRRKSDSSNRIDMKDFKVKDSHVTRGNLTRLKERTETVIKQTNDYFKMATEAKQYETKDAELLFNDILSQIKQLKEDGVDTSLDNKVDLMIHIGELAVIYFTFNQKTYEEKSSVPALLQKEKDIYYKVFVTKLGQRDSLVEMMNLFLKSVVKNHLEDRLTNTELMQILRDQEGDVFKSTQALQGSIMVDILAKDTFEGYLRYITQYEEVIKETLTKRSIECLERDNRLKELAKSKLSTIIDELKLAINKTIERENNDFIGTLFSYMKGLKKPHNAIEAYKMVLFDDKEQFVSIPITQLMSSIKEQFEKDIESWETSSLIREKDFTHFAFTEIVGCTTKCPFCKVPCDAHTGGRTQGKHRAILHRPRGLGDMVGAESRQLKASNCNEGVASETAKRRSKTGKWMKHKDYKDKHPDWIIEPSTDTDREMFWKRVLRDFNKDFARHYNAKKANIPLWWYDIGDHDVEEDLVNNYGVSRDEITERLSKAKCKTSE